MDNTLVDALKKKHEDAYKALDHFRQMHKLMHDEMDKGVTEQPTQQKEK